MKKTIEKSMKYTKEFTSTISIQSLVTFFIIFLKIKVMKSRVMVDMGCKLGQNYNREGITYRNIRNEKR